MLAPVHFSGWGARELLTPTPNTPLFVNEQRNKCGNRKCPFWRNRRMYCLIIIFLFQVLFSIGLHSLILYNTFFVPSFGLFHLLFPRICEKMQFHLQMKFLCWERTRFTLFCFLFIKINSKIYFFARRGLNIWQGVCENLI